MRSTSAPAPTIAATAACRTPAAEPAATCVHGRDDPGGRVGEQDGDAVRHEDRDRRVRRDRDQRVGLAPTVGRLPSRTTTPVPCTWVA